MITPFDITKYLPPDLAAIAMLGGELSDLRIVVVWKMARRREDPWERSIVFELVQDGEAFFTVPIDSTFYGTASRQARKLGFKVYGLTRKPRKK